MGSPRLSRRVVVPGNPLVEKQVSPLRGCAASLEMTPLLALDIVEAIAVAGF